MTTDSHNYPWYRHRWPWILISIPAASMLLGVILLTTAFNNPAILVVDNYYSEGKTINQSMAMDERARELGINAQLTAGESLNLQLVNAPDVALRLFVFHVTDDSRDRSFVLLPDTDGTGFSPATATEQDALNVILNSDTSWYFELRGEQDTWRLRQRISTPIGTVSL